MANARLLDRPEDYKQLGLNPDKVEMWEDGRRNNDSGPSNWEWWYFDMILDDGTTSIIQFFTNGRQGLKKDVDVPTVTMKVTTPDGKKYQKSPNFKADDASFSKDQCDVKIGNNIFKGDLKNYEIFVDPADGGIGADLKLVNVNTPYRPGTAYFNFGEGDEFYTWFCTVPKCKVTGTLTYNGKTIQVNTYGYHDHQWGKCDLLNYWNNWVWAHQSFEDYTLLVFDMVSSKNTNFTRFPIVFVQNKEGQIVFQNTQNVECTVLEEYHDDEASGKDFPKAIHYIFENDGKKLEYTLTSREILEATGKKNVPLAARALMKAMKLDPSYARYLAHGEMKLTDGEEEIERSGKLIYEFMYPGESFRGHM